MDKEISIDRSRTDLRASGRSLRTTLGEQIHLRRPLLFSRHDAALPRAYFRALGAAKSIDIPCQEQRFGHGNCIV